MAETVTRATAPANNRLPNRRQMDAAPPAVANAFPRM
jgi:hypothetical protein